VVARRFSALVDAKSHSRKDVSVLEADFLVVDF
jgi:hypothetical protein